MNNIHCKIRAESCMLMKHTQMNVKTKERKKESDNLNTLQSYLKKAIVNKENKKMLNKINKQTQTNRLVSILI